MGLLQACRHDSGGPGIPAVVRIQMPAGEKGAVGVVEVMILARTRRTAVAICRWNLMLGSPKPPDWGDDMPSEQSAGYLPGDPRYGWQGEALKDYYRTKQAQS